MSKNPKLVEYTDALQALSDTGNICVEVEPTHLFVACNLLQLSLTHPGVKEEYAVMGAAVACLFEELLAERSPFIGELLKRGWNGELDKELLDDTFLMILNDEIEALNHLRLFLLDSAHTIQEIAGATRRLNYTHQVLSDWTTYRHLELWQVCQSLAKEVKTICLERHGFALIDLDFDFDQTDKE